MHSVSVPLANKIKQSIDVNSSVRLIAEWNQNRYSEIFSVTNGTVPVEQEFDNDAFPLTSIVEPERPNRGIVKALITKSYQTIIGNEARTMRSYMDRPTSGGRYTTASKSSKYKYWTSKNESTLGSPFAITGVSPTVLYTNMTWANKIHIVVENSYASPSQYLVQVSLDGTTWTTVATNPAIDSKGRIQLYRQANGTWSTATFRDAPQKIKGIRLIVNNMNLPLVHFNLIEMGARIESDLSTFVESYNVSNSMSDTSFIAPIGKASSNTGEIQLDNTSMRFANDNPASLYYKLLDKNVEMRLDVGINIGTYQAPNFEWVRQITMRTENWAGQTYEGTTVEVKDASDYLQSIKPSPMLMEKVTVGEAIWKLLDSVGFSEWFYDRFDIDHATLIPQCWFDGEKTVWEEIQTMAEATQTAVYFDEYGMLQIKTRDSTFYLTKLPVWTLDENKNGTKQPDIVSLAKTNDFEANVVNINYKPTSLSKTNDYGGVPMHETVWEPEETVTLRSSQLYKNMLSTDQNFMISPNEAVIWPFTGIVQIQGELIRYDAKQYSYYPVNNVKLTKWIVSEEEQQALDSASSPTLRYLNAFTGYMRVPTEGRGVWNTTTQTHSVALSGWTVNRYRTLNGAVKSWDGGLTLNASQSTLNLKTNSTFIPNSWYISSRTAINGSIPIWYGTRLKYDASGYTYGASGIAFSLGSNDSGYFVELVKTSAINANDLAKYTHELCFYKRDTNGAMTRIGPDGNKGVPINVANDVWYDLDVGLTTQASGTIHNVSISVNGIVMINVSLTTNRLPLTGRFGMFTRGNTSVQFEYYYSSAATIDPETTNAEWWNRIKGGYQSGLWDREQVYNYSTALGIKKAPNETARLSRENRFFDEFGPIVHEVREFDIKFAKSPVTNSSLYVSNESQVACVEYNGNPFGAKFILANVSRDTAVVSGEDTNMFGTDNASEQKMAVVGRTFSQEDTKTYTVKDTQGIKARGEISTDIESPWIQSEAAAKRIGEWIITHWGGGCDELEVEIFGNPILQLLDVVGINMPSNGMNEVNNRYFVVRLDNSYEKGLTTKLTLRRMKI